MNRKKINVRLSAKEITKRKKALKPFVSQITSGWLKRYSQFVTSADTGAVLADTVNCEQ